MLDHVVHSSHLFHWMREDSHKLFLHWNLPQTRKENDLRQGRKDTQGAKKRDPVTADYLYMGKGSFYFLFLFLFLVISKSFFYEGMFLCAKCSHVTINFALPYGESVSKLSQIWLFHFCERKRAAMLCAKVQSGECRYFGFKGKRFFG